MSRALQTAFASQLTKVCCEGFQLTRRGVLRLGGAAALAALGGLSSVARTAPHALREYRLRPQPAVVPLVGSGYPDTPVWGFDGAVPGPELRLRQGQRLRVVVRNDLDQPTTVHWHGLRLPNAMDGVPGLTQAPIAPGETFTYEFICPDAGTFWYHPHYRSFEQVGRGLYGPLIVEERQPPAVDRELTWVLDDWRLTKTAAIRDDFGNGHDISHAGRIGNTVTVNGQVPGALAVRAGERLRLRLINAANARSFALLFEHHRPWVIAVDGQPVEPHRPVGGRVVLGAAMRVDLILDLDGEPGSRARVIDAYYPNRAYLLTELAYGQHPALRDRLPDPPAALAANPLTEPDLVRAERVEITFAGGAMSDPALAGAQLDGRWTDIRSLARQGIFWVVNGVARRGYDHTPLLILQRGRSYRLALHNDTVFDHPIHLHGHHFRVIGRNDQPTRYREWQDTVLLPSRERAELALVADNPGDWMFHCHVLEHQLGGMMGVIRVA